ncbi:5-formyltetrahydrofolate cyclo-ligase [Clostridium manihotivorum]|uniref:5-formyltetrahydrofolate cyclo-ligase n=1 Tax=Clostridium manihotivorum TaxID=2320868 RepID=A0A3R5V5Z1_9CLOT|nr:5-formyltetrahydrofolate cyclo-ligase [Clostridium manihotivorum]QAA30949.1 5-formyltetrahydrofolate cyclo-ligase [Clostridium manihotivorum]
MNKKDCRNLIKNKRRLLDKDVKLSSDNAIKHRLLNMTEYKKAKNLFIYVSMEDEIYTHEIINLSLALGKKVFVPKVDRVSKTMIPVQINSINELIKVPPFGILEPEFSHIENQVDKIDLAVTPGLAFSRNGDRLGYGAGYYDKFFKENKDIVKVALAYDFQILDFIPTEVHDEKINFLISEKELIII